MSSISPYAWPGMDCLHSNPRLAAYRADQIIIAVCEYYLVNLPSVMKGGRFRKYVKARYVSWHIIRQLLPEITLKDMGYMLGRFDHTTVMHGLRKIDDELNVYPELAVEIKQIINLIKSP